MTLERLRIDRDRLWRRLEAFSKLTDPMRPWTRRSFTPLFGQGREWLAQEMKAAGLQLRIDAGGNLIGSLSGTQPALPSLATGSHSDTVPSGGRFDGILGVIAGIEVAQTLAESGLHLAHTLEVVDFLAEEPSEYGVSCVGSRSWAGMLSPDMLAAKAPDGESLAEGLRRVGGHPEEILSAQRSPQTLAAFVELHIEQGPVLEAAGLPIGVVTSIVGIRRWRMSVIGRPDHAGTTPMTLRRDALVGAARIVDAISGIAAAAPAAAGYLVATVGKLDVHPNAINAVPGRVDFVLEMRSDSNALLDEIWTEVDATARRIVSTLGLGLEMEVVTRGEPALCHEPAMQAIEAASERLGLPHRRLVSGAGHDAVYLSRLCPTGMVFIPCLNGRSHCPEEWASAEQVGAGTDVLLQSLVQLDRTLI